MEVVDFGRNEIRGVNNETKLQGNATYKDMKTLIDFVKKNVKEKNGINLDLEIVLVE